MHLTRAGYWRGVDAGGLPITDGWRTARYNNMFIFSSDRFWSMAPSGSLFLELSIVSIIDSATSGLITTGGTGDLSRHANIANWSIGDVEETTWRILFTWLLASFGTLGGLSCFRPFISLEDCPSTIPNTWCFHCLSSETYVTTKRSCTKIFRGLARFSEGEDFMFKYAGLPFTGNVDCGRCGAHCCYIGCRCRSVGKSNQGEAPDSRLTCVDVVPDAVVTKLQSARVAAKHRWRRKSKSERYTISYICI